MAGQPSQPSRPRPQLSALEQGRADLATTNRQIGLFKEGKRGRFFSNSQTREQARQESLSLGFSQGETDRFFSSNFRSVDPLERGATPSLESLPAGTRLGPPGLTVFGQVNPPSEDVIFRQDFAFRFLHARQAQQTANIPILEQAQFDATPEGQERIRTAETAAAKEKERIRQGNKQGRPPTIFTTSGGLVEGSNTLLGN